MVLSHRIRWIGIVLALWTTGAGFVFDVLPWLYSHLPAVSGFSDYQGYVPIFFGTAIVGLLGATLSIVLLSGRSEFWLYPMFFASLVSVGFLNSALAVPSVIGVAWHIAFAAFAAVSLLGAEYLCTLRHAIARTHRTEFQRLANLKEELWVAVRIYRAGSTRARRCSRHCSQHPLQKWVS
jgi:hypothetical protein